MKEKQGNRVTILISFLVLVTRGQGISYKNHRKNSPILPLGQVYKTIQLKCGDVYDCIDVNVQPSLNHPKLKDHKIQMQPSSFPAGLDTRPQFPHSASQVQPSIIDCPVGTVPVLRNNISSTEAAHNIDEVGSTGIEKAVAGIWYRAAVYGATALINVWEPKVNKDSKDYSAAWIQINSGGGEHTDRIGAGVMVNPSLSGDTFARFHVAWTEGLENKGCIDQSCPGFVQVNRKWAPGARAEHVSVYDGTQWGMIVKIFKDKLTKNWWVTDGKNTPLGYWPSALFTFANDRGDYAFWGGVVSGPTATSNAPQMGSGHLASQGYRRAASMKNVQILNENNTYVTPEDDPRIVIHGTSNSTLYTVDKFRVNMSGMRIYYGGPGLVV